MSLRVEKGGRTERLTLAAQHLLLEDLKSLKIGKKEVRKVREMKRGSGQDRKTHLAGRDKGLRAFPVPASLQSAQESVPHRIPG